MKPFSILHISDLHRSPEDPISNDELISALVNDRDRYIQEDPRIAPPDAVVVSGDIIQGVPLNAENSAKKILDQYTIAEEFLDELVRRFLDGDRSRIIMVPGNHDIDWNMAFSALEPVEKENFPNSLNTILHSENSSYRCDRDTLTLYRISDYYRYNRRLEAYWKFFKKFYEGIINFDDMEENSDVFLFSLYDDRIGAVAYNSCHGNDCFAFHGMIRKESIARSYLDFKDCDKIYELQMAVWHHDISGPPYRTDYMDIDTVHSMIGRGFRLGLYGHQHKTQVAPHEVYLPDRERMAVVSAGSLCAGTRELPVGVHRQYNVLEISENLMQVRVHVRAMTVANLFSRIKLPDFGGSSYIDLDWEPPRNMSGKVVNTQEKKIQSLIFQAEGEYKTGRYYDVVNILRNLRLPEGSYQRHLYLASAEKANDWNAIIETTNPPTTIGELIQRFEAFSQCRKYREAINTLNQFSKNLQLPESTLQELHNRVAIIEEIRQ